MVIVVTAWFPNKLTLIISGLTQLFSYPFLSLLSQSCRLTHPLSFHLPFYFPVPDDPSFFLSSFYPPVIFFSFLPFAFSQALFFPTTASVRLTGVLVFHCLIFLRYIRARSSRCLSRICTWKIAEVASGQTVFFCRWLLSPWLGDVSTGLLSATKSHAACS